MSTYPTEIVDICEPVLFEQISVYLFNDVIGKTSDIHIYKKFGPRFRYGYGELQKNRTRSAVTWDIETSRQKRLLEDCRARLHRHVQSGKKLSSVWKIIRAILNGKIVVIKHIIRTEPMHLIWENKNDKAYNISMAFITYVKNDNDDVIDNRFEVDTKYIEDSSNSNINTMDYEDYDQYYIRLDCLTVSKILTEFIYRSRRRGEYMAYMISNESDSNNIQTFIPKHVLSDFSIVHS